MHTYFCHVLFSASGKAALLEMDEALQEHGLNLKQMMSDVKTKVFTFLESARNYALSVDLNSWKNYLLGVSG